MRIYNSVEEIIGHTPLVELQRIEQKYNLNAILVAKFEGVNPAGSAKDRVALQMLNDAESAGIIKEGAVIIEPTSGNTGIGLAAIGAIRGYRVILVMPDTMSIERRKILKGYGAEIELTPGALGMSGAIARAEEMAKEIPGSFIPSQFDNPSNPRAHVNTTGPEIWEDTDGRVDMIVAGAGTGGTITGIGQFLKEKKPSLKAVAIEPATSAVLSGEPAGKHGLQGIGAGFIPKVLDVDLLDEVIKVTDEDAIETGKMFGKTEGYLIGISGGAAVWGAIEEAKKPENEGKMIVVIIPDSGDKYLSTALFE